MSQAVQVMAKLMKDLSPSVWAAWKKRMALNAKVAKIGIPSNAKAKDGKQLVRVALDYEFGNPSKGIAERPCLRPAIQQGSADLIRMSRGSLVKILRKQMDLDTALGDLGHLGQAKIQERIRSMGDQPEGSNRIALRNIDAEQLSQSVISVVVPNGQP